MIAETARVLRSQSSIHHRPRPGPSRRRYVPSSVEGNSAPTITTPSGELASHPRTRDAPRGSEHLLPQKQPPAKFQVSRPHGSGDFVMTDDTEITQRFGRSNAVVNNFLINPGSYSTKQRTARPEMISLRQEKQVQRFACKQKMSSSQIKDGMQLPRTSRTIRSALHRNTNVVYKKLKGKPSRSVRRIDSCLNFEQKHVTAGTDWNDVVFSNEKKFHFDGPNGILRLLRYIVVNYWPKTS
ncbi:hypothetical protein AVEN_272981-1 [Araneus ventricosus]|uniref:Transposase Tc1-like domain-containing protein n=1 Tax=Araneus ventricosus TaxID=182803 RepID=A0A4Y2IEP4_ARAVE|nr:hypothetical protein AVEN_272981-1 [Araneus ventricosus]